jgi:hypothetical protein
MPTKWVGGVDLRESRQERVLYDLASGSTRCQTGL